MGELSPFRGAPWTYIAIPCMLRPREPPSFELYPMHKPTEFVMVYLVALLAVGFSGGCLGLSPHDSWSSQLFVVYWNFIQVPTSTASSCTVHIPSILVYLLFSPRLSCANFSCGQDTKRVARRKGIDYIHSIFLFAKIAGGTPKGTEVFAQFHKAQNKKNARSSFSLAYLR